MRKKKHKLYRDSETGEFVKKEYADENPKTTTSETVKEEEPVCAPSDEADNWPE